MICEKCKLAGDVNQNMHEAELEVAQTPGDTLSPMERNAFITRITQLHEQCQMHDCMCQHRVGVYVARGQEVSKAAE